MLVAKGCAPPVENPDGVHQTPWARRITQAISPGCSVKRRSRLGRSLYPKEQIRLRVLSGIPALQAVAPMNQSLVLKKG